MVWQLLDSRSPRQVSFICVLCHISVPVSLPALCLGRAPHVPVSRNIGTLKESKKEKKGSCRLGRQVETTSAIYPVHPERTAT